MIALNCKVLHEVAGFWRKLGELLGVIGEVGSSPYTDEEHIFYFTDPLLPWGNHMQVVLPLSLIIFPHLRREPTLCQIKLY